MLGIVGLLLNRDRCLTQMKPATRGHHLLLEADTTEVNIHTGDGEFDSRPSATACVGAFHVDGIPVEDGKHIAELCTARVHPGVATTRYELVSHKKKGNARYNCGLAPLTCDESAWQVRLRGKVTKPQTARFAPAVRSHHALIERTGLELLEQLCEADDCLMSRNTWIYFLEQDRAHLKEKEKP